jgi:hypothetical protein
MMRMNNRDTPCTKYYEQNEKIVAKYKNMEKSK